MRCNLQLITWDIFSLRQDCGMPLKSLVMRGWWPFLPTVIAEVELISATRILTRDRMTNGLLTGNRRAQIHYLQLSLISGVNSMVFVRLRCIQAESSPILL